MGSKYENGRVDSLTELPPLSPLPPPLAQQLAFETDTFPSNLSCLVIVLFRLELRSQKKTSQTDLYLVILSSKTYVLESNLTKYD